MRRAKKVSIPYVKGFFGRVSTELRKFDIISLPKPDSEMKKIIVKAKDEDEKENRTNIVYKINCDNCNASYVGQTKRIGAQRIFNEHSKKKSSVVSNHKEKYGHDFDYGDFQISDRESYYKKRLVSEMIHINMQQCSINQTEDTR